MSPVLAASLKKFRGPFSGGAPLLYKFHQGGDVAAEGSIPRPPKAPKALNPQGEQAAAWPASSDRQVAEKFSVPDRVRDQLWSEVA